MYERLEVVFSELYVESLKEKDISNQKNIKTKNKNTIPKGKQQKQIRKNR